MPRMLRLAAEHVHSIDGYVIGDPFVHSIRVATRKVAPLGLPHGQHLLRCGSVLYTDGLAANKDTILYTPDVTICSF